MIYKMIKKKIEPSPTALEPGDGEGRATGVDSGRATCCYSFLGSPQKIKKYKKIHIKKYIRKEKNRSEKKMLELP
jgi:hypothetical protein